MRRPARVGRRTVLLSATLVASATAACFPGPPGAGPSPGVVPVTPPPAGDRSCNETEKGDAAVVKCCVKVTKPEGQRECTAAEQAQLDRCCPE